MYQYFAQAGMDVTSSNQPAGTSESESDEQDFPLSLSSVKDAVKSLISSCAEQSHREAAVAWDPFDDTYTNHEARGVALVIINETFRGHKGRTGCQLDAHNLSRTFSLLGFHVRLVRDCTLTELKNVLEKVAEEDHSGSSCFVLAMSSHGDKILQDKKSAFFSKKVQDDVVFCTDFYMTSRDLMSHFSDAACPTLKGKPRLFFLQACRGDQLDPGQEVRVTRSVENDGEDEVDGPVEQPQVIVSPVPCYKDALVMCATPPGFYAFRRPTDGSWFVQALCSVLEKCDGSRDVLQLLTRVSNIVAQEYQSRTPLNEDLDKKKQTPCIYSMLTKDLHWCVKEQPGTILTWE